MVIFRKHSLFRFSAFGDVCALSRLLRRKKFPFLINRTISENHCLFCAADGEFSNAWIVESRGPMGETGRPGRSRYPYLTGDRIARTAALAEALADLEFRLTENSVRLRQLRLVENSRLAKAAIAEIPFKRRSAQPAPGGA